jgi:transposase InsO family protein
VSHANARLTFHGRCMLVRRVRFDHRPVAHVAKEMGVSRQCGHRWLARFDAEGWDGLRERSSRPRSMPRRTPAALEAAVIAARLRLRQGPAFIAEATGVADRTVTRILRRAGLPRLAECDPLTGDVIRASRRTFLSYERDRPGSLVHVDVKKLGKIPDGGGWRAHGRGPRPSNKRKVGYDYVHSAVDDHTRLAYSEILSDEKGVTCAGFLTRAREFFAGHGITIAQVITDNAKNYLISTKFRDTASDLNISQLFIKAHCPWQNGKVERFNRTLQTEWAYREVFDTNDARSAALAPWLEHYNHHRRHTAIGGKPPISRVSPT